jgi:hypothetical protein
VGAALLLGPLAGEVAAQELPPDETGEEAPPADPEEVEGLVDLRVSALTGVLGPGAVSSEEVSEGGELDAAPEPPLDLELRALVQHLGDAPLDGLRLVVEVHGPATSRGGLRSALEEGLTTSALHVHEQTVREDAQLDGGDVAGVEVRIPGDVVPWAADGGVHPVRVAVVRGAAVLDEVTTAVMWLDEPPGSPLLTTALWPLDEQPWRGPDTTYPGGVDATARPGGRIDSLLRAVERHPDAPVLLAPPAHLLEDLRDRADGYVRTERLDSGVVESREVPPEAEAARRSNDVLQRIREVLDDSPLEPLSRPYADADLPALVADETTRELAGELVSLGRSRADQLGERATDRGAFLLPAGTDRETLDLVPADTVLLPYDGIVGPDPADEPTLPSPVRDVRSDSGRPLTLLVGDPYVTDLLAEPPADGPVLAAQRVLAETAMIHFQAPSSERRALSLHPPESWSPTPELAQRLLAGLADAPWLELTDPTTVTTSALRGGAAELSDGDELTLEREQLRTIAETLDDLEAATDARAEEPELDGRSPTELRDALLRATTRWYPAGSTQTDALIDDVAAAIDHTLDDVSIASGSLVTLTSDTGTIPVTLQRGDAGPLTVRVEVASQGRLTWERRVSEPIQLEAGQTQTVTFPTRALSTGTFSVSVRVTDPTGRLELDRTTLSVRSTAISGPALSAIGGLVVVLLLAGLVRRRPKRRLEVVR